jgi:hypothetical protein
MLPFAVKWRFGGAKTLFEVLVDSKLRDKLEVEGEFASASEPKSEPASAGDLT